MRIKIITALLLAGTVVGCASNPPPPPPMAEAPPPPPPAPMVMGPVDGLYKGMATLADGAPRGCAKMTRAQTVRVRANSFVLMGVKATIAPDGTITAPTRRGTSVMGTATPGALSVTAMKGKCSYSYAMSKS